MSDSEIPADGKTEDGKPENSQAVPWGLAEIAIGVVGAMFIGVLFAIGYRELVSESARYTVPRLLAGLAGGWIAYGGVAYLVTRHWPGGLRRLGLRFDLKRDIVRGVLLGVAGQLLVALVYLPLNLIDSGLADKLDDPAKRLTDALSGWRWLAFAFFVGVVSPVCEELFFRGVTLKAIAGRWGVAAGIVGSGIIFGLIHLQPLQMVALAAFGVLLAYRASRTDRLGEVIIGHAVFNLLTVLSMYLAAS
jgi:membrane protease YdiL (CAAX protease family)